MRFGTRPEHGFGIQTINTLGRWTGTRALCPPLVAKQLMIQARRRTGLEDFGAPDLKKPLHQLLVALNDEAQLTLSGWLAARGDLLRLLCNRLKLVATRRAHPEIAAVAVEQPLFIIGLPRTGTSLLHGILAQDKLNRVPMSWEVIYPTPPPTTARYEDDPRIARAERLMRWIDAFSPHFQALHTVSASLPQECLSITAHAFMSMQFQTTHTVPTYQKWLNDQDLRATYAFHRRFLQHLGWRCPGRRWVLKSPAHLFAFDALFSTYPDAGIIQTHRDPTRVMASLASLGAVLRGAFSDAIDHHKIGAETVELWQRGLDLGMQARDVDANRHFLDIAYADLMADPMAVVKKIYRRFDLPLSVAAQSAMRRWLAANPKHKHGRHAYNLEAFGLDEGCLEQKFAAYRERFNIPREHLRTR